MNPALQALLALLLFILSVLGFGVLLDAQLRAQGIPADELI